MTANGLSLARLFLALPLSWSILTERPGWAFFILICAMATDFADGRLARSKREVSDLGGFLDHTSDAVVVVLGLGSLTLRDIVPIALPIFVTLAFIQYVTEPILSGRPRLMPTELGRANGIAYYCILAVGILSDWAGGLGGLYVTWIGWFLIITTLLSIIGRLLGRISISLPK